MNGYLDIGYIIAKIKVIGIFIMKVSISCRLRGGITLGCLKIYFKINNYLMKISHLIRECECSILFFLA